MRALSTAGAVALVVLAAACSSTPRTASPPSAPPSHLTVSLEQSRDNENRHLIQVVVRSDGGPTTVTSLQLRGGGFTTVPPTQRVPELVDSGTETAFPTAYGTAVCSGTVAPTTVALGTTTGRRELTLPTDALLPRLRARECALDRLAEAVRLSLADLHRSGDTVVGSLVLQRGSRPDPVRLTSTDGSVIFTLRTGPLPVDLPAGAARASVPVTFDAARCDPHALIESKRTYVFPLYVSLAGAEPLYTTVSPDAPGKAVMEQLLLDTCRAVIGA